jgi:hypothetical protein
VSQSLHFGWEAIGRRDVRFARAIALTAVGLCGIVLTQFAISSAPRPAALVLAVAMLAAATWFVWPVVGLHLIVLFALVGDLSGSNWYPYTKNMSAVESIMFVSNVAAVSPLEVTILVAFTALIARYLVTGVWTLRAGDSALPLLALSGFVLIGFLRGVGAGGDFRTAVFEVRAMLVLPAMYVLVVSVLRTGVNYRRMLWTVLIAIVLNAILSLNHILRQSSDERGAPDTLIEHTAALRMNVLLLLLLAALLFKGVSAWLRFALVVGSVPVIWLYFLSERRAAFVSFGTAVALLFFVLFWRQRSTFLKAFPVFFLVFVGYTAAFWSSESTVAFPAQAVKSVIAPDDVDSRDESSDLYRQIENFDLNFTIQSAPVLGLGYGQPFYRPIPLADISAFELNQYIPHNSMLAIWVKTGFGGFAALFFLFGRSVMKGARRLRFALRGNELLVMLAGVTFAAMTPVFAFVDITWDARTTMLLAFGIAICCDMPIGRRRSTPVNTAEQSEPDPVTVGSVG